MWEVGSFIELLENENSYSGRQFDMPVIQDKNYKQEFTKYFSFIRIERKLLESTPFQLSWPTIESVKDTTKNVKDTKFKILEL